MKTLILPVLVMFSMITFCSIPQSNATYVGPDCNQNSLLGYPLVSPYFGKKIAFVSNVQSADPSNFTLYTVNSNGSGNLNKIDNISYPTTVAISYDGTKIAFIKKVGAINQIFSANTDGTDPKQLTFDNATKSIIGITPDGTKIIYANRYDTLGLVTNYYTINSDGKNQIQITHDQSRKDWPALSFDGTVLVFNDESDPAQIFSVRTDGSNLHHVTNGSLFSHTPVISYNGSKLVFSRNNPNDSNSKYIFTINNDGTQLVSLTPKPIYSQSDFTISLDGSKVAFDDGTISAYYVSVINQDGTSHTKILNTNTYYSHTPLLSANGSRLVYASSNPTQILFMFDMNGYRPSLEIDSGLVGYEKEILPDTAQVVYPKIVNKTEEIMAATPGGKPFPLFDNSIFKPNTNCKTPDYGLAYTPAKIVSIPKYQNQDVNNAIVLAEVEIPIAAGIAVGVFMFTRKGK